MLPGYASDFYSSGGVFSGFSAAQPLPQGEKYAQLDANGRGLIIGKRKIFFVLRCFASHKEYEKWYEKLM
ncbi:hypothetical protein J4441_00100 [Candidatus Micrarchaeota archaeon]|nr:hypothetical protein [Candidatus Micrarchaeota archaeon]